MKPDAASTASTVATRATRMALLALAGAIEGLLLSNGPLLERFAALRVGTRGLLIDLDLLFAFGFALAGAAAALAPWTQNVFLALLATAAAWSLSESSTHPFWLLGKSKPWHPTGPSARLLAAHLLAIALVCGAAIVEAWQTQRRQSQAQRLDPGPARSQARGLALAGGLLLALVVVTGAILLAILDAVSQRLQGALAGPTAFFVLVGSACLLAIGLAVLGFPGKGRKTNDVPESKP